MYYALNNVRVGGMYFSKLQNTVLCNKTTK